MSAQYLVRPVDEIFGRLFQTHSQFHSEADRQERIAKTAADEEQAIYKSISTPAGEKKLAELSTDVLGWIEDSAMTAIMRAALKGDADRMRTLLLVELDNAVKRDAERIAKSAYE